MARQGSDFNRISNTTGAVLFDDIDDRGHKMAVMIRRIFPSRFRRSQYIGLHMDEDLDGSISVSAPACYNVRCGEQPVNGVSAITYAENGDIILYAPRGRVRIMAKDIDLIAEGNGADTGFVNIHSNSTIDMNTGEVRMVANDAIGIAAERNLNLNSDARCKISCGSFKVVESPDVSPVTSLLGSGANSPLQTLEGLKKLLQSIN
jgi:hypothetical protein|tara:strand:+ start:396 stop:1010 length:615 start_codon:yes stop_codon:yes gene_type:complete